ncbi:hypothetical protein ACRDNQ_04095 [Palleronia sp. KMU-117]|uniref:hypothetical protein n=1 Tax=Palleronia sp. KMU-117 TaxID=3434108 RepID=UPI003D75B93C
MAHLEPIIDVGGQLQLFAPAVHCVYCGKATYSPHYVVKHFGRSTYQLPFCNEQHANDYYLEQLRENGL